MDNIVFKGKSATGVHTKYEYGT